MQQLWSAEVQIADIFGDHMVLQGNKQVPIWGKGVNGQQIDVHFNGQTKKTVVKNELWKVILEPMDYGGPHELKVTSAKRSITISDVLIGEVWIASGQSNMAYPLRKVQDGKQALNNANHPKLRLFKSYPNLKAAEPLNEFLEKKPSWAACTTTIATDYSAVAYYFGKMIMETQNIPVGIIVSSVGGTKIEHWISENHPIPFKAKKNKNGVTKGNAFHFNAMINPLIPFACRGVLWYQGESNARDMGEYEDKLVTLIKDWRTLWDDDIAFQVVQLANFSARSKETFDGTWPRLREAQFNASSKLPKVDIANIIDLGNPDDIHPTNKKDVGYRLSLIARKAHYGEEKLIDKGPIYRSMKKEGNKLVLDFELSGSELQLKENTAKGFFIAGPDKKFHPADAIIRNNQLILSSKACSNPLYVRYAFANNPDISLFNKEGLPAYPFRTDDFARGK
jgi:sialate O-acetylesterase